MAIRQLSLQEFDRFRSARAILARLTDKAVEWFADDTGRVLGAISYHRFHSAWSFIVLVRDTGGSFRGIARDCERHRITGRRQGTTPSHGEHGIGVAADGRPCFIISTDPIHKDASTYAVHELR